MFRKSGYRILFAIDLQNITIYLLQVAVVVLPTNGLCGGTIINPNHVLTACRCILNINNELFALNQVVIRSAGVLGLTAALPNVAVTAIFPHPHFNPFTQQNDLAVIRVRRVYYVIIAGLKTYLLDYVGCCAICLQLGRC